MSKLKVFNQFKALLTVCLNLYYAGTETYFRFLYKQ